jgi:rhodanese-related sulfurtransferase
MDEAPPQAIYGQLARIGRALSNPVRLRLLDLLIGRERTVEQLSHDSGYAEKNTSAQLQQLLVANLVTRRKDGTRVYYRLADESVPRFLDGFQTFAEARLADLRNAIADQFGDLDALEPVTVEELSSRLDNGVLIVDVRPTDDYLAAHLPDAISIPSEWLLSRLDDLPQDIDIVAYCQGPYCVTSAECVRLLREHGRQARHLVGGFARWYRTEQPLETEAGR